MHVRVVEEYEVSTLLKKSNVRKSSINTNKLAGDAIISVRGQEVGEVADVLYGS